MLGTGRSVVLFVSGCADTRGSSGNPRAGRRASSSPRARPARERPVRRRGPRRRAGRGFVSPQIAIDRAADGSVVAIDDMDGSIRSSPRARTSCCSRGGVMTAASRPPRSPQ